MIKSFLISLKAGANIIKLYGITYNNSVTINGIKKLLKLNIIRKLWSPIKKEISGINNGRKKTHSKCYP